jgi:hypothetical protein
MPIQTPPTARIGSGQPQGRSPRRLRRAYALPRGERVDRTGDRRVAVVTRPPRPLFARVTSRVSSYASSWRREPPVRPDGDRPAEEDVRAAMVRIYVNDTPAAAPTRRARPSALRADHAIRVDQCSLGYRSTRIA